MERFVQTNKGSIVFLPQMLVVFSFVTHLCRSFWVRLHSLTVKEKIRKPEPDNETRAE